MRGLEPDGNIWNMSFPIHLVEDPKMQLSVRNLLADKGLSLQDSAVLADMLKKQVQADAIDRLRRVWQAHGLEPEGSASIKTMDSILDMHTATYIWPDMWKSLQVGMEISFTSEEARKEFLEIYPAWPRTQIFLREALEAVQEAELNFDAAQVVVLRVLDRFGRWQDQECDELKHNLVKLERPRPGRVDLVRFYGEAVNGNHWGFAESIPYLRQLGALDESDPLHPSVLIPNYISSAANHVGDSRYFQLACIDECQELLGHMERRLGAPTATVDKIAAVVSRLPSPSHPEHVTIPSDLLGKLKDIAVAHGGKVPLHGRLFAQWMHHLYPRDCLYPHVAGSTSQEEPEEYQARTGIAFNESIDSMIRIISSSENPAQVSTSTALPWDMHEEVLDSPMPAKPFQSSMVILSFFLAGIASGAVLVASLFAGRLLLRSARSVGGVGRGRLLDVDGAPAGTVSSSPEQRAEVVEAPPTDFAKCSGQEHKAEIVETPSAFLSI